MAVFLTAKCYDISRPLTSFHDSAAVHVRPLLFWHATWLRLAAHYRYFGTHRPRNAGNHLSTNAP